MGEGQREREIDGGREGEREGGRGKESHCTGSAEPNARLEPTEL